MRTLLAVSWGLLLFCWPLHTFAQVDVSRLDPAKWPGKMPADKYEADIRPLRAMLKEAMDQRDEQEVTALVERMKTTMGPYVGAPEKKVDVMVAPDPAAPDMTRVTTVWQESRKRLEGHFPWDIARRAPGPEGTGQPRVREHAGIDRGYLSAVEAGVENAPVFLQRAREGLDFLLTIQGSNGCFGYPYDLKSEHRLRETGRRMVELGRSRGMNIVENGWIINDFDWGDLQYTNGHGGLAMLTGYLATGDGRYLDAGLRSAEHAITASLCTNWNYNAFSVWVLARAYRVTKDKRFLLAAIDRTRLGVLPGQMGNGRWFDQHNALPWYHNIIMWGCVELCLACREANHPFLDTIEKRTLLGIDSMAAETNAFGIRSPDIVRTLAFASMAFGPRDPWEQAMNVCVNYLCAPEAVEKAFNTPMDEIFAGSTGVTGSLGFYILYKECQAGRAYSGEIDVDRRLNEIKSRNGMERGA